MSKQEYTPSGSDQSEDDLRLIWTDRFCDPLTTAIRPWSTNVDTGAQAKATSNDLFEGGRNEGWKTTTIPADAFTGSFGATLYEGLGPDMEPSLVWFRPTEMSSGSVLLKETETPGVGIQVSVLATTLSVNPVTGMTVEEQVKPTVGWIIPDRIPHTLTAFEFLRGLSMHWGQLRKFQTSQMDYTTAEVDETLAAEWRASLT